MKTHKAIVATFNGMVFFVFVLIVCIQTIIISNTVLTFTLRSCKCTAVQSGGDRRGGGGGGGG